MAKLTMKYSAELFCGLKKKILISLQIPCYNVPIVVCNTMKDNNVKHFEQY